MKEISKKYEIKKNWFRERKFKKIKKKNLYEY